MPYNFSAVEVNMQLVSLWEGKLLEMQALYVRPLVHFQANMMMVAQITFSGQHNNGRGHT